MLLLFLNLIFELNIAGNRIWSVLLGSQSKLDYIDLIPETVPLIIN